MKKGLVNLALLFASIAISFFGAEIFLRFMGYGTAGTRDGNVVHQKVTGEFDHYAVLNSLNLREKEITKKLNNEFRILVVGDSFTYGLGVEEHETFVRQTESLLREWETASGFPLSVRVINGGVGMGPSHQLSWLKGVGMSLQPDIVVQAFFVGNDVYDDLSSSEVTYLPTPPSEAMRSLIRRSELLTLLFVRLISIDFVDHLLFDLGLRYSNRGIFLRDMPDLEKSGWRSIRMSLEKMNEVCLENNIKFAVLIIPTSDQVRYGNNRPLQEDYFLPNRMLTEILSDQKIPYIDLLPRLEQEHDKQEFYYSRDLHWTSLGHRVAAEIFSRWLRDNMLKTQLSINRTEETDK